MTAWMKLLYHSFQNAAVRRTHFIRTIFNKKKTFLVPRTPEGFSLDEFKVFYYFPGIRVVSAIGRIKYFKAAAGICLSAMGYVACKNELIPMEFFIALSLTAASCTLGLFATSRLCTNIIGKMYINKGRTEIVLAYINSRGQRINKTFKSSELQISEHPNILARKYFKQVLCLKKDLKYNLYYGESVKMDVIIFHKVFPNYE